MTWNETLIRIRRFLRDPQAKIWSDAILLAMYNDVQREIQIKTGYLTEVRAVRVPPLYDFSYLHDWEWPFLASQTGNYQALRFHQQGEIVYSYRWETQAVWGLVACTETDDGTHFTHPFEAFLVANPGDIVPLQFPEGFHEPILVAWDNEPIDALTKKDITRDDSSWATRKGEPFAYWRPDKFEDLFCLYPIPSTVNWDDVEGAGVVTHNDEDTISGEYGIVIDTGIDMLDESGDIIRSAGNVLFIYKRTARALSSGTDESCFPAYLQKYIEYGTLERAYGADTDGKIPSLRDYWLWRKEIGIRAIIRFKGLKRVDRDYRLTTKGAPGYRTRRQPRLPDAYPAVW